MFAPTAHLTAPVWHWGVYYKDVATKVQDGTWTNEPIWWDMGTGVTGLSPYNEIVPQEVRDQVAEVKASILENDQIFTGPLSDNMGEERVKDGVALTDGEKLSIQWFVKGVNGEIPDAK